MVEFGTAKKLLIALIVIGFGLTIAILFTHHKTPAATNPVSVSTKQQPTQKSANQSDTKDKDSDLAEIIGDDDNPDITYTVTSTSEPVSGWMVVHVVATNEYGNFNQIAILQRQADGSLKDVAGPDTSFLISFLNSINAPPQVVKAVPTQNE